MLTLNILTLVVLITSTCGEDIGQHIVGGENADNDDFPLVLKLLFKSELICGGALITQDWAITTASCVVDRDIKLLVPEWKFIDAIFQFSVNRTVIHPKYQNYKDYSIHNVALLSLDQPTIVPFNAAVTRSTLAASQVPEATMGTVVGWGRLSADGPFAENLQKVELPILSDEQCKKIHGEHYDPETNACAGFEDPNVKKDVCFGDFGNILYVADAVYGLASWANTPCHVGPKYVAVFTKLPFYSDWINENLKDVY